MGLFGNKKKKSAQTSAPQYDVNYMQAQDNLRILGNSLDLLKTTMSRDTFYYRLKLAEESAARLVALEPYVKMQGATPSQILEAFYRDKEQIINDFEMRYALAGGLYYENLDKINAQWSVLSNLKIFEGEQADLFEQLCYQNIDEFKKAEEYKKSMSPGYKQPTRVPAYVRLAMLYEKRNDYTKAIQICVEAIRNGAYEDGSSGKMYGRLARMIKKSGITVPDEIKNLALSDGT